MQFKPRTEQELIDRNVWPKAVYQFEIIDATEKVSQQGGNPMIELKIKISRADGTSKMITDYLLDKKPETLRSCCAAIGLLDKYETGVMADDDFVGRGGKLRLGVEKDKSGQYPPKNVVAGYVVENGTSGEGHSRFF